MSAAHIDVGLAPKVIIIPYWVKRALDLNKLDYIEVKNFSTLRRIMSVRDVATFLCVQKFDFENCGRKYIISDFSNVYTISNYEKNSEYVNIVEPLSHSVEIIEEVKQLLAIEDVKVDMSCVDKTFEIQESSDRTIYIFLKEGFLNALSNPIGKKIFLSSVLKSIYKFLPINEVSGYEIYKEYIRLL